MGQARRPIAIDLFCGVGGMSLGFEQAGFEVAAAVDNDPVNVAAHAQNFPSCKTLCADLTVLTGEKLREDAGLGTDHIDIVFGGPPCQGFSMMGKRQLADPRNVLLQSFARIVMEVVPSYFVLENVDGLLMGQAKVLVERFIKSVEDGGYGVVTPVKALEASTFGMPQRRKRAFILGYRLGLPAPLYPEPLVATGVPDQFATVWDAIGDLPNVDEVDELAKSDVYTGELGKASAYATHLRDAKMPSPRGSKGDEPLVAGLSGCGRIRHSETTRQRFRETSPGTRDEVTWFYRLEKDGVSPTLRAGTTSERGSFTAARPIHPVQARCITVREAARLHSFPDWFQFDATKWHSHRQIGNSVPPLLARTVADALIGALIP